MPDNNFYNSVIERICLPVVHRAGRQAAYAILGNNGAGRVIEFQPKDGTRYLFAALEGRRTVFVSGDRDYCAGHTGDGYLLATNWAGLYPFHGNVEYAYAAEKWGNNNLHTGVIVSEFIFAFLREVRS